ncbi:MAG: CoA-binding protein [Actinomycetota bacterium]
MVSLEELEEILRSVKTIAVVGASRSEQKAGHSIPSYLQQNGYRIIPVNPNAGGELFGEPVYKTLADVDVPVDMVDVFRPPADADQIARDAVAIAAKVVWFQPGTASQSAVDIVAEAGIKVVTEACAGVVHRLINRAQVR